MDLDTILDGSAEVEISNAGGEMLEMVKEALGKGKKKRLVDSAHFRVTILLFYTRFSKDHRTCTDRTERWTNGFKAQIEGIVDCYLEWSTQVGLHGLHVDLPEPSAEQIQGFQHLEVMDAYRTYKVSVPMLEGDTNIPVSLVRQGFIPCSPFRPAFAVATRLLQMYHRLHVRCPHLAIQPFVRSLYDFHGIPFTSHRSQQFSNCYDLYLEIQRTVRQRVDAALQRGPNWRMKNTCPACTYKLKDEPQTRFAMLITMDGNDSLKRVISAKTVISEDSTGETLRSRVPNEWMDLRDVGSEYFIPRDEVEQWEKHDSLNSLHDPGSDNPCAARWRNMSSQHTSKMWGVFDESGIFVALCRHGFVLAVTDIVRSGEKAKYPLSIVHRLLENFGDRLGVGYDIGCRFKTTINNSALGPRARELQYTSLVGAFHGHAHNRLCQLSNLVTYIDGLGLEDLEGCERFFSKSNALASPTRYASVFHRRQRIAEYMRATDTYDTYANLSKFIVDNYQQALNILAGEPALRASMKTFGYSASTFPKWLEEERAYLQSLPTEPLQETYEMDYYMHLVELNKLEKALSESQPQWFNSTPDRLNIGTPANETKRRHLLEKRDKALHEVQNLEVKLKIRQRWILGCPEWDRAKAMVQTREYQKCLDKLEGLVVQRIFEMTKMNMSQVGYKLRKHIGIALKTRSHAIHTAVNNYNDAAKAFNRSELSWEDVVEYAFLAEFDLLRDCRDDVRKKPWASPSSRKLSDEHFKIQRAHEEITRLNIEIKRLITYMRDDKKFIEAAERKCRVSHPLLAHQIKVYHEERAQFNFGHLKRLAKLSIHPGFTGSLRPGAALSCSIPDTSPSPQTVEYSVDDDVDSEPEDDSEDILHASVSVLTITSDI
ncbi:hypothetical protein F5887DRAFT_887753 [Amanita rubescens]|nr:hypothetical protein F5887DRAFT_887753 [Amanita rubescens]